MKRPSSPIRKSKKPKKSKGAFVLFIGDDGAILTYFEQNQAVRRLFAQNTEDKSTEALGKLLAEYPLAPIYVLVDVLDQAYVRHTLPPVTPLGVNKIIQRRLNRDFGAEDLKGAISLGREKKGRKDWNFLLISLAYSDRLKSWLALLYDLPNRLKGIYLSPVESEAILHQLKKAASAANATPTDKKNSNKKSFSLNVSIGAKKKPAKETGNEQAAWDILVLNNKTGGFRQVVLKNGKFVFTRMAQSTMNEKPTVLAGNIEQEIKNTIEYLKRLSFAQGSALSITIIVGEEIKVHLSTDSFNATHNAIYTPHEAAELLGIGESVLSGDRFTDVLLSAAFLHIKKHRLKLLSNTLKQTEKLYQLHQTILSLSCLIMMGLIGISGYYFYEGIMMEGNIRKNKKEVISLEKRIVFFKEKTKDFKEDPYKIDALIKINDLITAQGLQFTDPIKALSPFITDTIKVNKFEWTNLNPVLPVTARNAQAGKMSIPPMAPQLADGVSQSLPFEAIIEWSLLTKTGGEKKVADVWNSFFESLTTELKPYKLESKGIENANGKQDEITINFEESTRQPNANNSAFTTTIVPMRMIPNSNPPTP